MSSRRKSLKRVQKQPGLLKSFTRSDAKEAIVDKNEQTVIDLEDDDPVSEIRDSERTVNN